MTDDGNRGKNEMATKFYNYQARFENRRNGNSSTLANHIWKVMSDTKSPTIRRHIIKKRQLIKEVKRVADNASKKSYGIPGSQ